MDTLTAVPDLAPMTGTAQQLPWGYPAGSTTPASVGAPSSAGLPTTQAPAPSSNTGGIQWFTPGTPPPLPSNASPGFVPQALTSAQSSLLLIFAALLLILAVTGRRNANSGAPS